MLRDSNCCRGGIWCNRIAIDENERSSQGDDQDFGGRCVKSSMGRRVLFLTGESFSFFPQPISRYLLSPRNALNYTIGIWTASPETKQICKTGAVSLDTPWKSCRSCSTKSDESRKSMRRPMLPRPPDLLNDHPKFCVDLLCYDCVCPPRLYLCLWLRQHCIAVTTASVRPRLYLHLWLRHHCIALLRLRLSALLVYSSMATTNSRCFRHVAMARTRARGVTHASTLQCPLIDRVDKRHLHTTPLRVLVLLDLNVRHHLIKHANGHIRRRHPHHIILSIMSILNITRPSA
jgi:hypothetical protein